MSPNERLCNGNCNICSENKECTYCREGYLQKDENNKNCYQSCQGHSYCYYDKVQNKFSYFGCMQGYMQSGYYCDDIRPCLYASPSLINRYNCYSCEYGYLKQVYSGSDYRCYQKDWHCDPSRYILIEYFYHNQ